MSDADNTHMRHALAMGARGQGQTWPNPSVGCVIVQNNRIVGRGFTQNGGTPHAETMALAQAGAEARGAVIYVTLEPCAHQGRTPPCALALVQAGVSEVVIATGDPDPRVSGKGIAILQDAGIKVKNGVLSDEAQIAHAGFMSRVRCGRPMVTLKLAASLDGRIATATRQSKWITGSAARRLVHGLRARHDAVMVGGGTARADDPTLNVRDLGVKNQPVRVVWSRHLDLPLQGRLAQTADEIPLWIIHADSASPELHNAWLGLGARLLPCPETPNRQLDPVAALQALGEAGLTRVFCEGGGGLAASLLGAGLVDELVVFHAGICIGSDGLTMVQGMGVDRLEDATGFDLIETRAVGDDVMTRWRVK